jgi:hypothetical protein
VSAHLSEPGPVYHYSIIIDIFGRDRQSGFQIHVRSASLAPNSQNSRRKPTDDVGRMPDRGNISDDESGNILHSHNYTVTVSTVANDNALRKLLQLFEI